MDVRVKRADVASDHHLVVARLKLKLKRNWMEATKREKYNVNLLKDPDTQGKFSLTLTNMYKVLKDQFLEESSVEDDWQKVKEGHKTTCQEVLGPMRHHQKEWISAKTLQKIQTRKQTKAVINNYRTRAAKAQKDSKYITLQLFEQV